MKTNVLWQIFSAPRGKIRRIYTRTARRFKVEHLTDTGELLPFVERKAHPWDFDLAMRNLHHPEALLW